MVDPNDIVIGGWDISKMHLEDAMDRARVLDINLQKQLHPLVHDMVPMPSIYDQTLLVVNALAKQRAMFENLMRACIGLSPDNNMMSEY